METYCPRIAIPFTDEKEIVSESDASMFFRRPLSVIIPCFNVPAEIFAETLQSLQRSTFQNFDLIIIDDGSSNIEFRDVLRNIYPNAIIIYHQTNQGISSSRNDGVESSNTPLFLQLDADDQVESTFIEKAISILETHPEWSFCNSWVQGFGAMEYFWNRGFDQGSKFLLNNCVPPTAMIRKTIDRAIGGHDETIVHGCEDWDYWLRMASNGYWGGTIPEYLIRYRHHVSPSYWPNRDDPVLHARFTLKMWLRYPTLKLVGFWHRIIDRWRTVKVSEELKLIIDEQQGYLHYFNVRSQIFYPLFIIGLALGATWLLLLKKLLLSAGKDLRKMENKKND